MVPKKARALIDSVSKNLNVDSNLVTLLIDSYWKTLRKTLTNAEYSVVNIRGLGKFKIKKKRLLKLILDYESILKETPNKDVHISMAERANRDLPTLRNLLIKVEEEDTRCFNIRKSKYEKDVKGYMES